MRAKCQHLCKMPHIPHCSRCPPPPSIPSFTSCCCSFAASLLPQLSRLSVVCSSVCARLSTVGNVLFTTSATSDAAGGCGTTCCHSAHTQYNLQRLHRRRWLPQSRQLATGNWRPPSALTRAGPEKLHSEAALIWRECQPFSIL